MEKWRGMINDGDGDDNDSDDLRCEILFVKICK